MDNEKERFTVTLKPSLLLKHKDNPLNSNYCESELTEIYLQQRMELLEAAQESEGMCKTISTLRFHRIIELKPLNPTLEHQSDFRMPEIHRFSVYYYLDTIKCWQFTNTISIKIK